LTLSTITQVWLATRNRIWRTLRCSWRCHLYRGAPCVWPQKGGRGPCKQKGEWFFTSQEERSFSDSLLSPNPKILFLPIRKPSPT
jgi:hypothetical protein